MTDTTTNNVEAAPAKAAKAEVVLGPHDVDLGFSLTGGKKNTVYSPGDDMRLDLSKPRQRQAAENIILSLADYAAEEGVPVLFAENLDIADLPESGSLGFTAKFTGKGDLREVVSIAAVHVPDFDAFYKEANAATREFFASHATDLMLRIAKQAMHVTTDEDGTVTAMLQGLPLSAFDILAPKARAIASDPFQHIAVAFVQLLLAQGKAGKAIPASDIKRCIMSAHFATTSAYADFERPTPEQPNGFFTGALDRLNRLLIAQADSPEGMGTIIAALRAFIKGKRGDELSPVLLAEMVKAQWCENTRAERLTAMVKARQAGDNKTEKEKAADGLLALMA